MWWSVFHTVSFILVLPHVKCQLSRSFSDRSLKYWFLINSGEGQFRTPPPGQGPGVATTFLLSVQSPSVGPASSTLCTEGHGGGPAALPSPGAPLLLFGTVQTAFSHTTSL